MSKENEEIFKHCDSFVVLSNDEDEKQKWIQFGQNLGLECMGNLDSSFEGKEEIYARKPYLKGRIVDLERGEIFDNSIVINALVSDIIRKSKYADKEENKNENYDGILIDDTKLGFELGYGKKVHTEDGTTIKKVMWTENAVPSIYKAINEKARGDKELRINGIRANFILCAICKAAKKSGVKLVSSFDIRTKKYIPIRTFIQQKGLKQSEGIKYNIIENKENIFIDMILTKEKYSLTDYEKCVLPKVDASKNLYLSGRLPNWLLASIVCSYDAKRIFSFQAGKGFTCVSALEEKDLGRVFKGIDGIDIIRYFNDEKLKHEEKQKNNLPEIPQKQGVFEKLKKFFGSLYKKNEVDKYLDDSIIAEEIQAPKDDFVPKEHVPIEGITDEKQDNKLYEKNNKEGIEKI